MYGEPQEHLGSLIFTYNEHVHFLNLCYSGMDCILKTQICIVVVVLGALVLTHTTLDITEHENFD